MVLIANYKTWFKDTNPTFKPFLFFKGEELVPANRDLHDYGIKYEILNLMDLKMSILDNWIKDNQNMYKIKLTNGQNVLKEVELTENEMFEHSRGFRVK